ncbi:MAG: CarD family transcriptional regulator [Angelakisella sp.]|nr:CarD family transcriptional regulator [Angelakisella sp.]
MFSSGDLIMYGNTGVCKVVGTAMRSFSSDVQKKLYYELEPVYQGGVIYTPAENPTVFMRPVITEGEARELIDMIPSIQAEAYHSRALNDLSGHYGAKIQTHDCRDLVELTMSIYEKKRAAAKQKRKVGAVDERFMKRAEELLFGELAAALCIPRTDVQKFIAARLQQA